MLRLSTRATDFAQYYLERTARRHVDFAAFAFVWRLTDSAARSGVVFTVANFPRRLPNSY